MDTNSTNNQHQPKSWDKLVTDASKAEPPGDLEILPGVQRAIAAQEWSASEADTVRQSGCFEELAGLVNQRWALAGLGVLAIVVVVFGVIAIDVSGEAAIAYELSSWFNPQ